MTKKKLGSTGMAEAKTTANLLVHKHQNKVHNHTFDISFNCLV